MDYQMVDGDTIVIYLNDLLNDPSLKPLSGSAPVASQNSSAPTVTLIVRSKDEQTKFKLATTDKFKKLFDGYCKKYEIQPNTIKFIFDGDSLDLDSTPETEDMEDGDIIDIQQKKK